MSDLTDLRIECTGVCRCTRARGGWHSHLKDSNTGPVLWFSKAERLETFERVSAYAKTLSRYELAAKDVWTVIEHFRSLVRMVHSPDGRHVRETSDERRSYERRCPPAE